MNTLGIIGMGNMGTALYKGVTASASCKGKDIEVYTYDKFKPGGAPLPRLVETCRYILLAVKPQQLGEVLEEIAPLLNSEHILISICAGISAGYIQNAVKPLELPVVQVMPNTPMMLGEGAAAVAFSGNFSPDQKEFVRTVIGSCSPIVEVIPPDKMNEIICINGSSPAFTYLFAEAFMDYAAQQEIPPEPALRLFAQTLIGAGRMLMESGMSPQELIAQVSSKGGTTVAGLEQLRANGFVAAVQAACEACTKRAYEL